MWGGGGESAADSWKLGSLSRGKTAKMAIESTFPAGKCLKFPADWFTFPEKRRGNISLRGKIRGCRKAYGEYPMTISKAGSKVGRLQVRLF